MANSYASLAAPLVGPKTDLTDPAHFEQFVATYSSIVLSLCLRLLKDRFAAEDACQETFAAAWRHRAHLQPNQAWLLKVATNKCLDELRWRSRRRDHTADGATEDEVCDIIAPEPLPDSVVLCAEAREVLRQALLALPCPQRVAVVLSDVEGWTYLEIAGGCGVSIGTVKSRIFRARKTLRELLNGTSLLDRAL